MMLTGHAGGESPHICPLAAIPFVVRIKDGADKMYDDDPRFKEMDDYLRGFAIRVLSKIQGLECIVRETEYDTLGMAYHVTIRPKITVMDPAGFLQQIGMAQIPVEYVEIVNPSFWRAS